MICNTCIRSVIAYGGISARSRSQLSNIRRSLHFGLHLKYKLNFQATMNVSMMMDSGSTENQGPIGDVLQEKDNDGGYISGGWKSDDCKLSCGYSSIRGKRATMEDRYDVKKTNIDGKTVCLFGIFDGHGGSRAAEYLKEHLFDNLLKHPQFMQNTKLAIRYLQRRWFYCFNSSSR